MEALSRPERVKRFNQAVRFAIRKSLRSRSAYGFLFCDEVGFEKRGHLPDALRVAHGLNLHCHGLYFGPYVDWKLSAVTAGGLERYLSR